MSNASPCAGLPGILESALLPPGFCVQVVDSSLDRPRSVIVTPNGEKLVVERGRDRVVAIVDNDGDLIADETPVIVQTPGIRHGVAVHGGYIYASSSSTVYRWSYTDGQRNESLDRVIIIKNINAQSCSECGAPEGHRTRTLVFDAAGRLYVSVGSVGNVDPDSYRSRIRRFNLSNVPPGGFDFDTGEVFADGLRNEVGLAFDRYGVLWGVENGADKLFRDDLGGDIHNENPAEELNRFPEEDVGKHYGYPYCFTEFRLPSRVSRGPGSQWVWPSFMSAGYTDEWCRNNSKPAVLAMQAHSAPLGITFFDGQRSTNSTCTGGFPSTLDGAAFVPFHGSWNRDTPTGFKVVQIPFNSSSGFPSVTQPLDFMCSDASGARWDNGLRPVDAAFDECNRLYITSDGSRFEDVYVGSMLLVITYHGGSPLPPPASVSVKCDESPYGINPATIAAIAVSAVLIVIAAALVWRERLRREKAGDGSEKAGDLDDEAKAPSL